MADKGVLSTEISAVMGITTKRLTRLLQVILPCACSLLLWLVVDIGGCYADQTARPTFGKTFRLPVFPWYHLLTSKVGIAMMPLFFTGFFTVSEHIKFVYNIDITCLL